MDPAPLCTPDRHPAPDRTTIPDLQHPHMAEAEDTRRCPARVALTLSTDHPATTRHQSLLVRLRPDKAAAIPTTSHRPVPVTIRKEDLEVPVPTLTDLPAGRHLSVRRIPVQEVLVPVQAEEEAGLQDHTLLRVIRVLVPVALSSVLVPMEADQEATRVSSVIPATVQSWVQE